VRPAQPARKARQWLDLPAQPDLTAPRARKARLEQQAEKAKWWWVVPVLRVLPARQARKA
jgi:hypothetical protein